MEERSEQMARNSIIKDNSEANLGGTALRMLPHAAKAQAGVR